MRMNYDELARFKNLGCRDEGAWHRNRLKGHERLEYLGILSVTAGTTSTSAVADVTMFSHQPKIRSYPVVPITRHDLHPALWPLNRWITFGFGSTPWVVER